METVSYEWRGWLQLILGFGLTFLFFYMMAPFIVAILLGAVIAIICYPAYLDLMRRLPRHLSALILTVSVTLGILLPLAFVLYSGAYRIVEAVQKIKLPGTSPSLDGLLAQPPVVRILDVLTAFIPNADADWLKGQAITIFQGTVEKLSLVAANFLSGMPALILAFAVVILSVYFLLVDGSKFLRFLSVLSPLRPERSMELYGAFEKSCRGVVVGIFASGVLQGILMTIAFLVTRLPNAFLMGVITIVMGMVPVVGSAPLWIGGAIYLFFADHFAMAIVMLIFGTIISTSDNIVRSLVMKGQSEMHPLLALVSVFGAVNLMGPTGIFLGPIIAAVFVSFLRILALELRRESMATSGGL